MSTRKSSNLPHGWTASNLESVVTFFAGGTSFLKSEYVPTGTPVLTKGDVKPFGRIEHSGRFVDTGHAIAERYRFTEPGDLLVTTRDLTTAADFLGLVAPVPPDKKYLVNQGANVFRLDGDLVDSRYFVYWTCEYEYRDYIKSAVSGSTQVHIRKADWLNAPLNLPSMEVQKQIAKVLGGLDDKIELNRRMNETLEAMARAIFQSWFVDFDPVRAKASGESADSICQRLGLTPELLALFPNSFEDSELGEIPNGWAVTTLQSMTSKIGSGATPRGGREVYIEEGTSLIRSQNVYDSNFVWGGLARITDEAAKQLSGVEVKKGDVLINITGASILRTCVVDPHVLPARVNQHVAIIRAKLSFVSRYIHLHLLKASTKAHLMGLNAGASREAITKGHLESLPIIQPREELLECFGNAVAAIYAEVDELNNQKQTLEKIRDALLPKLLSGELEVREADAV